MKKQTFVVGYLRYSSKRQAKGNSELRQEKGFAAFVRQIEGGFKWHDSYQDKGLSGFTEAHLLRGDFGRLLQDCRAKVFPVGTIIYFEEMDRFGRMKQHRAMTLFHEILDLGYQIAVEGKIYNADSSEMEFLFPIIKAILAHEESRKKQERLRKAWAAKRERGDGLNTTKNTKKTAACPTWLIVEGTKWVINKEKQATLKEIARLSEFMGLGQIKERLQLGKGWKNIDRIVRSPALIGIHQPCKRVDGKPVKAGDPIKGFYPAVLTESEYYTMQSALDGRKSAPGRKGADGSESNLFTHMLFDSQDGQVMNRKGLSRGQKVLQAADKKGHKYLDYQFAEDAILWTLHEIKPSSLAAPKPAAITELETELAKWTAKIKEVNAEMMFKSVADLKPVLEAATARRDAAAEKVEAYKRDAAKPTADESLLACQAALLAVASAPSPMLRAKLKAAIKGAVKRIDCRIAGTFDATFRIEMNNGTIKSFRAYRFGEGSRYDQSHGQGIRYEKATGCLAGEKKTTGFVIMHAG